MVLLGFAYCSKCFLLQGMTEAKSVIKFQICILDLGKIDGGFMLFNSKQTKDRPGFATIFFMISYFFFDESINLRVINDVYDSSYFPLIKSFSELNFNPTYSENLSELKIISFPIISLLINSLFYKFLGSYSFLFLELIIPFTSL